MAAYQIPAPTSMDIQGDVVENWKEFECAWKYYMVATGLASKMLKNEGKDKDEAGEILVAAALCSVMGKDCLKIMNSLPTLTENDKKDPVNIIAQLRAHFIPQRHVLFERYKFNSADQKMEETIDAYVIRLRQLANSCEFEDLKDSLVRDRLVMGTTDIPARDRLLRERPVPNLLRCIESLRACEISRLHKKQLDQHKEPASKETTGASVDYVRGHIRKNNNRSNSRFNQNNSRFRDSPKAPESMKEEDRQCGWCGRQPHDRTHCPAKNAVCGSCNRRGHYRAVCRMAKTVQEVEYDEEWDEVDVPFLGEVTNNKEYWSAVVTLDGHPCEFKLDTGAEVTILSDKDWSLKKHKLTLTKQNLGGPGGTKLEVLGSFEGALEISGRKHKETVYVLKNQASSLLSKRACEALDLLRTSKEVYEVTPTETPNFKAEFPELFTGLGRFKEECHITLREGASPMCLYTARKVPHPLLPQVEKELKSMVEQGVISPVTEPTQWCSGMVPVPKSNGRVRICVDLTSLNKAVIREIHPMKSVDENLAKLRGSSFYSKLDANSGFWQIPLNEHSQLLTTFISPFGRFCFNRLPFGISSAPEIFQRMMSSILIDLEGHGVICHMDDVLIYGQTEKEHDSRVRTVLQRMKDAGMTLNEKCEFSKKKIQFLGHILSSDGIQADPAKISAILDYPPPLQTSQNFSGLMEWLIN